MNYLRDSWRRWVAWLLLAAVFAVACGFLSNWQFHRRTEALAKMNQLAQNYDRSPIELNFTKFKTTDEWLPIKLTGHYLPGFWSETVHLMGLLDTSSWCRLSGKTA
jgi:cytochrome oxidase assembly protein ShyY1